MNRKLIGSLSAAIALGAALAMSAPAFADGHGHGGGGGGFAGGGRGGYSMGHGAAPSGGGRMGMGMAPSRGGGFSGSRAMAPSYGGGGRFITSPRSGASLYNGNHFSSPRANASMNNGSRFVAAPGARYGYTTGRTYNSPHFNRPDFNRPGFNRPGFNRPAHGIAFGGRPRYWAGGNFHGVYWPRAHYHSGFVRFVPVLPAFYSTFWFAGVPYYYWDDTYYIWSQPDYGFVATNPPPVVDDNDASDNGSAKPESSDSSSVYIYPKNGQSEEQTATDRYECHQWAASQSGFDPTNGAEQSAGAGGASDYRRAMMACLDARGYSAR